MPNYVSYPRYCSEIVKNQIQKRTPYISEETGFRYLVVSELQYFFSAEQVGVRVGRSIRCCRRTCSYTSVSSVHHWYTEGENYHHRYTSY